MHYSGNKGDTAKNNADYFSREVPAHTSANYFVDETSIWQSVKDGDTAHAVGGAKQYKIPCHNFNSIHIEMCNSVDSVPLKTRANAVWLTKQLMAKYGIDINHVVRHWDVTGKQCPLPWIKNEAAWTNFKQELKEDDDMTKDEVKKIIDEYLADLRKKEAATWVKNDKVMEQGKEAGITDGSAPMGLATRAEVVSMLLRTLEK